MTDQITILCPITSRGCGPTVECQPVFNALVPSMDALGMWGYSRVIFGYDADDPVWSDPANRKLVPAAQWIGLHNATGRITDIWNMLADSAWPFDYLIPANDDMAFQTPPLPAIETLKARNGFGTVAFADEAFPGLPTFYMVGRLHFEIFHTLYPLPWQGAHQDPWIADVYRPWKASEIDPSITVHNRVGSCECPVTGPRFEYGAAPPNYRKAVLDGRRMISDYINAHHERDPNIAGPLFYDELCQTPFLI